MAERLTEKYKDFRCPKCGEVISSAYDVEFYQSRLQTQPEIAKALAKLAHYEDLEELASFLSDGKMSIEDILERLKKTIQGEEKELKFSRILTNAEALKWDKWKSLEAKCLKSTGLDFENMVGEFMHYYGLQKQGKLIEMPCADGDVVYWRNVAGEIKKATICGYNLSAECNDSRGYTIRPEIIGKTVFFTREEAEAALKGAEQ